MSGHVRDALARYRVRASRRWLFPACLWSIGVGYGTIIGLAGKPDDAPHLHIPEQYRGLAWMALGVAAFLILSFSRTERATRAAAALLVIMPSMRAMSYSCAFWIYEIGQDAGGIGPWWSEGSPTAWYLAIPWWIMTWAIMSQATEWDILRERLRRRCGGFRKRGS